MDLIQQIEEIRKGLREGRYNSEAAISQGIVLPVLHTLGWPIFNTQIVVPEYSLEGRRVDFALCYPSERPVIFIEVKKIGGAEGADKQLFEYAFHRGIPFALLTDGQEWNFYLPGEAGFYQERRVYKLDVLERTVEDAVSHLKRYLEYTRVCTGEALKAARLDYQDVSRRRDIERTLPQAWQKLLKEKDEHLLELLADNVEDLCGFKPDLDTCADYLEFIKNNVINTERKFISTPKRNIMLNNKTPYSGGQLKSPFVTSNQIRKSGFVFYGKSYEFTDATSVMIAIFQLLAEKDSSFFERFAERKHGRKRRYLSREKENLYPGRPDLQKKASKEIAPGWWIGTNYSNQTKRQIIQMACEVAGIKFDDELKIDLG